ncbi:MAG: carbohydrate ABC transporter permease [Clostridia bacterium]|nr:carbohydrate ABC transporter permease [Clostridia bacterium]
MDMIQENVQTKPVNLKKHKLRMPYERNFAQACILTVVIFCLLFSFLPLFLTLVNAFKPDIDVQTNAFSLPKLASFAQAAKNNFTVAWAAIGDHYFSTILVSLLGAIGQTVISAVLAYILTFKNFYFKDAVFMLFIAVLLVPSIIGYPILLPLIRDKFGLDNSHFGYLLPIIGGGQVTGMFLFKTFFGQQPKSLYESAKLDGANDAIILIKITVPLALPIILYHFVGCFSGIYNEYLWASLLLSGDKQTLANTMESAVSNMDVKYGSMYAMYLISSFPLIITVIISMKYFKSGEFAAGLKL